MQVLGSSFSRVTAKRICAAALLLTSAFEFAAASEQTVAERFKRAMEERATLCLTTRAPGDTSCEILRLPHAESFATTQGRFAQSLTIPNAPKPARYRAGMDADDYFASLCKAEAGDFVYQRVTDVEGIVELRPRAVPDDYALQHLYALEDPFGIAFGGVYREPQDVWVQPILGRYRFLDILIRSDVGHTAYQHFYRDVAQNKQQYHVLTAGRSVVLPYVVAQRRIAKTSARYGFTWRGISRPHDREFGIAGGELIVLDLVTSQVLAFRRGFVKTGKASGAFAGIWWSGARGCSQNGQNRNGRIEKVMHADFIYDVLRPRADINKEFLGGRDGYAK
jgi:hypothetical protein